ncbi:MAG TPA: hypothetical protein VML75_19980 [Kofleriaceae bacterium]|nr:hypothetical protein [Kofleriaceae bacterium]
MARAVVLVHAFAFAGCFLEVASTSYKLDQASSATAPGGELPDRGVGIGINVGLYLDFERSRVAGSYGHQAVPAEAGAQQLSASAFGARWDRRLGHIDGTRISATGFGAYGKTYIKDQGAKEMTGQDASFSAFAGVTAHLGGRGFGVLISMGPAFIRTAGDVYGTVTGSGMQARVTLQYLPQFMRARPKARAAGTPSGGGPSAGSRPAGSWKHERSPDQMAGWETEVGVGQNVIPPLAYAAKQMGCAVEVSGDLMVATCGAQQLSLTYRGSKMAVLCRAGMSHADCRQLFERIMSNVLVGEP